MKKDWTLKKEKSHNFGYLSIQFKPLFGKQYCRFERGNAEKCKNA